MEEEQVPPQGNKRKHTFLGSEENSEDASPHKGQRPTKLPRSEQGGATHQADTPPTTTPAAQQEQEQEEEEEKAEAKEQEEEEFRLKRVCFCPLVKRTQKFPGWPHYHVSTKLSDDGIRRYVYGERYPWEDQTLVSPTGLSKFGGNRPFLPEGEEWPKCKSCGVPLEFVFQLHTRDLPPSLKQGEEEDPFLSRALGERLHRDDLVLQCFKFCENHVSKTSVVRWVWAPVRPVFPNLKWRAAEAVLTLRQHPEKEKEKETVEEKKVEEEEEAEEEEKEQKERFSETGSPALREALPQDLMEFISVVKQTLPNTNQQPPKNRRMGHNEETVVGWSRCEDTPGDDADEVENRLGREMTAEEVALPSVTCTFKLGGWMAVPFCEDSLDPEPCCQEFVSFIDVFGIGLQDNSYQFIGQCNLHDQQVLGFLLNADVDAHALLYFDEYS
ncbi:hypothetical protein QOT17_011212 [Balamuthia mandrillaris]